MFVLKFSFILTCLTKILLFLFRNCSRFYAWLKKKVLMELSVLSLHPPCEYLTSLIGASENTELAVFQLSCSSYCQREVLHSHKQTEWHIFSSA